MRVIRYIRRGLDKYIIYRHQPRAIHCIVLFTHIMMNIRVYNAITRDNIVFSKQKQLQHVFALVFRTMECVTSIRLQTTPSVHDVLHTLYYYYVS